MRRLAIAVVSGCVLFFAGSAALLTWITAPASQSASASASASPPAPAPAAEPAPGLAPPGPAPSAPPPALAPPTPPKPAPARSFKQQIIQPEQRHARTLFRRELMAGLAALQERVAGCAAAPGVSYVLSLEALDGALRIADVQVAAPAPGADAASSCVVAALQGETVRAPSAEPGTRWTMPFAPRAATVVTSR